MATSLPRAHWPASIRSLIDFSIDASVLQLAGDDLRFSHQLLQEALAGRALLQAAQNGLPASGFWPAQHWWQRSGWEVVAEIAGESCQGDTAMLLRLVGWLAQANPALSSEVWQRAGSLTLPDETLHAIAAQWRPGLCDAEIAPSPLARAAIGRALGRFDLDRRHGIDLGANGLPDIDWVHIQTPGPFTYQDGTHRAAGL